ncbi:MAG TPA: peptidylprolyl isomerase [Fimbriimonadaceae bacterium]|nr:peptidylprolyl isomerase [Fimbriimonadaceae bacterium]
MLLPAFFAIATFYIQSDIPGKYLVPAPKPTEVVAKVDGVEIKASDVQDLLWQWRGQEAVADMISYQVIKNAASKEAVSVPDAEVEKAMGEQLAQFTPEMLQGKTVDQYLLEQGFTKSRLWIRIRTELLLNKIVAKDFKPADYVKISTIVVRPESTSTKALTDAAKKADLFYDMLGKGDSWEKVLNLSTTDPRTLESKGLVGWRRMDAFPAIVQTEFKTLKAGQSTKPTQTSNGFQIFRIEAYGKDAKGKDLAEAEATHINANKTAVANKIRAAAKIERYPQ